MSMRAVLPWLLILGSGSSSTHGGELLDAVKAGDTSLMQRLLADPATAKEADADGTSVLHWAAHHGELELTSSLLAAGAAVDAMNRYGVRPLYLAAENGDASMVRVLLEAGADPNAALPGGETALMTAARTGDVATLEALLAGGADVNATDGWKGQTALMWAAAENHGLAVTALLRAGAARDVRSNGGEFAALTFAVRGGAIDSTRALLEAGADVNATLADGTSMLGIATLNRHNELAALLLDYDADPNADRQGWTALHQIVWSRRWNRGFNLPGPVQTGNLDSLDLVRKLVAVGANVDARQKKEPRDGNRNGLERIGATPFLLAAKSVDVPLMQTLLELGADAGIATEQGTTAVMAAAGVGTASPGESPGTVEEALAALKLAFDAGGGEVNDYNARGETALHGAVYRGGAVPLIEFLVARGAKLDAVNDRGWMPVRVADGIAQGTTLKRYPAAARLLREHMRAQGLPVPEVAPIGNGSKPET